VLYVKRPGYLAVKEVTGLPWPRFGHNTNTFGTQGTRLGDPFYSRRFSPTMAFPPRKNNGIRGTGDSVFLRLFFVRFAAPLAGN
jgi:hypothetical protein